MSDESGWVGLIGLGVVAWIVMPQSWTNAIWYGVKYKVSFDQVYTNNRPSDCDFSRSPLGSKGCSYKAVVSAFNAAGDLVAGDNAPKYSISTTGKPIISYDDGKTWWSNANATPDLHVKTVKVEWIKETE